jgi:4-hydroxy-4-methyl-2-oxoglutarate aldolase
MIEDAPLITLRRPKRRPTPAQLLALTGVQTGFVVDAMGGRGAVGARIRPMIGGQSVFCGVALPCHAGPADNLAVFAALELAEAGDVLVVAADGYLGTAVTGDLLLGMARNIGIAGFVTDGCVRDLAGIEDVGLPCFAAGVTPNSPARNGPGTVGLPIVLGDVTVDAGDIVLADPDGVVVIPFRSIDAVLGRLEAISSAESGLDRAVKNGLRVPDFVRRTLLGRIREVD